MRLTNQIRDRIILEVVEATTAKAAESFKKRSQVLALQLYNALYSKAIRDTVSKLPRGFMPEDTCLRFNLGGMNIQLNSEKPLRVPFNSNPDSDTDLSTGYRHNCSRLGNIANEELQAKYLAFHEEFEEHKKWVNKIRIDTQALLYSLQTYPQLEKTWPEGKKFYGKYAPKNGDSQLPAILISELNKTLGIV